MKKYFSFCITPLLVLGLLACTEQDAPARTQQANQATADKADARAMPKAQAKGKAQARGKGKAQNQNALTSAKPLSPECKETVESVCGVNAAKPLKCIKENKDKVSAECRNEMMAQHAATRKANKQKKQQM